MKTGAFAPQEVVLFVCAVLDVVVVVRLSYRDGQLMKGCIRLL
jgi:hypothetical protein